MYRIFIYVSISMCAHLWSQVPFAAIQQLPILQNTAFAGSKNSPRWVAAYNQSREPSYLASSQYMSYDGFWTRKKLGFAVHLLNSNIKEKGDFNNLHVFKSLFHNQSLSTTYPFSKSERMIGASIAPKYNLARDEKHQLASYTLSPSLGIDVVSQKQVLFDHWNARTARDLQQDTVYYLLDSLDFVQSNPRATQVRFNAGIKLNSTRFILSYQFSYHHYFVTEAYQIHEGSLLFNQTNTHTQTLKHRISSHSHWLTGAYSFTENKNYNLSMFGGLGFRQFVGKAQYSDPNRTWNSLYTSDKAQLNLLSQYYISGVFRYHKILLGGSYSTFDKFKTFGINLGYQGESFRIFTTLNAFPKSTHTLEIVISFFGLN